MMDKLKKIMRRVTQMRKEKEIIAIPKMMNSPNILEGKIALITGGSSGIGYAIAESFLKCGCKVIISGSRKEKLEEAERFLRGGVH